MDQSEFTPPARQSLTDQEISQRLGAATADEAGMLAAMDFLEEQTALRDQDNQATENWISKMKESADPRAAIALENLDRAKRGLDPLPLVSSVPEYPTFNNPPVEVELPVESEPVGSAEEAAEVFEEILQTPVNQAPINPVIEEVVTPENLAELPAPVVRGFRLVSAANWTIGVGLLAPALAASISALNGLNFVTSILAGLLGVLVGIKVNVLGLLTARRTNRGLAVASRASFGVFGSIVPGVIVLVSGLAAIATVAFGSGIYFNNTIVGLSDFTEPLFSVGEMSITLGTTLAVAIVFVAAVLSIFGGSFARWTKISIGGLLLLGFIAFAIMTIPNVDYLNLAGVFVLEEFLIVAPVFALVASFFTYGIDGESLAAAAWGAKRKTLTWPIFVFGFLLPLLSYGHFAALLNGHEFENGAEVIQFLLSTGDQISSTLLVDGGLLAIVGLLFVGISKLIEALKTLGTNHIGYGLASLAAAVVVLFVSAFAILTTDSLAISLSLTSILLIPAASWIGVLLTETLMRRGNYHDASLTRSYGFYGSVNWLALIGFILSVTFAFSISQPVVGFAWLGFLSTTFNFSTTVTLAALISMGITVLFTLATGFPRIFRQQRETKSVEDRKFDLVDVVVE